MCGLVGALVPGNSGEIRPDLMRMTATLSHRGPDDGGCWFDEPAGIAMGHRRLAVLDLSNAGRQPMQSPGDRFVIVFNGEIYNHLELRRRIDGAGNHVQWRGHSDTETLLASIEVFGVEETLRQCVGMFAFALWDRAERILTLARDRFGEKPLYYGRVNGAFVFGSELKAIRAYPGFANPVCRRALAQYLRFMYVPAPDCIYRDIFKLAPGSYLQVRSTDPDNVDITRYWTLADVVSAGRSGPFVDETAGLAALEGALVEAVGRQMLADVPLGAFLSGGVDSSLIVSLMQRQSSRPVKTFTVGFEEAGFDESPHARAVARYLGTDHREIFVTAVEAQQVIPRLPMIYDEPFADSSQIPTYLVCRAARQEVTVALSGDAGDELFGGYNRYSWGPRVWNRLAWLPYPARRLLGRTLSLLPVSGWDGLGGMAARVSARGGVARLGDKAHKLAAGLARVRSMDDLYLSLVTEWPDPGIVVNGLAPGLDRPQAAGVSARRTARGIRADDGLQGRDTPWGWAGDEPGLDDSRERMMYRDTLSYLPDDILCKVDRAAMAASLETRMPFLDHRVAEIAWRLPVSMKIRDDRSKWALRQILYKHVPRELVERPKAGFGIPVGQWLRGPLRDWAEALLDTGRMAREGHFHPEPIRRSWREHLSGRFDRTNRLWGVLMFQSWLESQSHRSLN